MLLCPLARLESPGRSECPHRLRGVPRDDAANSPVTTNKTQRMYGAFVMYRF